MIPSDHFVRFYNEVFKFLEKKNGLEPYYLEISRHQELHCLEHFLKKGLQGMEEYWGQIRIEENCICSSWIEDDVRYSHMQKCPSLSKVLDNDATPCEKYCYHCPGWVAPLVTKCGFYYIKYLRALDVPECYSVFSENGKIAFVVPAEILQVAYAEDLRLYLTNNLAKITLITFKTEVSLILITNSLPIEGIEFFNACGKIT